MWPFIWNHFENQVYKCKPVVYVLLSGTRPLPKSIHATGGERMSTCAVL